jgi:hypothetical protein
MPQGVSGIVPSTRPLMITYPRTVGMYYLSQKFLHLAYFSAHLAPPDREVSKRDTRAGRFPTVAADTTMIEERACEH